MINKDTRVCVCNYLSAGDIAACIRENNFTTLDEVLQNDICPMANKCESCKDEGYDNDGVNIPLVLSLVKRNFL